jgi:hypothetical protein
VKENRDDSNAVCGAGRCRRGQCAADGHIGDRPDPPPGTIGNLLDFAQLNLSPDDVEDLRTCRVGSCELKLGEQVLQRFRTEINWKAANARSWVDARAQRLASTIAAFPVADAVRPESREPLSDSMSKRSKSSC